MFKETALRGESVWRTGRRQECVLLCAFYVFQKGMPGTMSRHPLFGRKEMAGLAEAAESEAVSAAAAAQKE
mgnify:CR=1 FL=1